MEIATNTHPLSYSHAAHIWEVQPISRCKRLGHTMDEGGCLTDFYIPMPDMLPDVEPNAWLMFNTH